MRNRSLETPKLKRALAWLEAQTLYPKIYWEHPNDGIYAGVGASFSSNVLPENDDSCYFGGQDFTRRTGGLWEGFPESYFFAPKVLFIPDMFQKLPFCQDQRSRFSPLEAASYLRDRRDGEGVKDRDADEGKKQLLKYDGYNSEESDGDLPPLPSLISRLDSPSYSDWIASVEGVLKGIQQKKYQKVVLARHTDLTFNTPPSPFTLLAALPGDKKFAFVLSPDRAFIGATPETLFRREGKRIESAAVAGTRPRGKTPEEDEMLQEELLSSAKDQHEFAVVEEMIQSALAPFCRTFKKSAQSVLQTPSVQHLHHHFEGILKTGVTDRALIAALSPTPAVGGNPRERAIEEIVKREPFDRGWYGAPIGWVKPDASHFMVGIRSALLQKNHLNLFAGAGIVEGSDAQKEWEELEHKISPFMRIFL